MPQSPPRRLLAALAAAGCGVLLGCANLSGLYQQVDGFVAVGDYDSAAELIESSGGAFGARSRILRDLELATLYHLAGRYGESNLRFERAKRSAQASYTRSVSQQLGSWMLNDNVLEYPGEVFERALMHVFSALNYCMLRRPDEALVEVRQLDHLLRTVAAETGDLTYREDAFGRMLSGMLYEESADWDDAYIAYWKALEAYEAHAENYGVEAPPSLHGFGARVAERLGPEKLEEFEQRWGEAEPDGITVDHGRVAILHYNGPGPRKVEQIFDLSFGEAWGYVNVHNTQGVPDDQVNDAVAIAAAIPASDTVRVAFPRFEQQPYEVERLEVEIPDALWVGSAELVQDVAAIAERDLDDRINRIRIKAIARAALKYALAKAVSAAAAEHEDPDRQLALALGGAILRAFQVASERADVRSWRGLPAEIWMLEAELPAGEHSLEMDFLDGSGHPLERRSETVRVRPGERSFLIVRTVR